MRRYRPHRLVCVAVVLTAVVIGCSHAANNGTATTPSASSSRASSGPAAVPPGAIGVSPSGVTTRVDVPADSTEDEYFQACHAAKVWMDEQVKPRGSLLEPYLAMVQASASGTAGSWNVRWADLTPARQAAVITAAQAATAEACG